MKYYLIAGEASGDLHGSNLIKQLKKLDPEADFRCFGGDLMEKAGGVIAMHYRKMSFIGIWEVVKNLKTINRTLDFCKSDMLLYQPDAVILIDYPGFNLKMAEYAKEQGYKTIYYIAPKVWASRKSRIKRIRKCVDKLFVILPFEEQYFNERVIGDSASSDLDLPARCWCLPSPSSVSLVLFQICLVGFHSVGDLLAGFSSVVCWPDFSSVVVLLRLSWLEICWFINDVVFPLTDSLCWIR